MRSFGSLVTVLATFSAVLGASAASVDPGCTTELCGTNFTPIESRSVFAPAARHMSNAERLRRHLPLLAPTRRSTARRTDTSPIPSSSYRGYIRVDSTTGQNLGYISKSSFSHAQLRYQDVSNALIVDFSLPVGSTSGSQIEITMENSDITAYSFLSLIQGRDSTSNDLSPGSYNYGYFGGSAHTGPGASAQSVSNSYSTATGTSRTAESSVWSIYLPTGALSAQWINDGGSAPTTYIFTQSTALYIGGDPSAFSSRYPSPVTVVQLFFVPL